MRRSRGGATDVFSIGVTRPAQMPAPSVSAASGRERLIILGSIAAITILSWIYLVHLSRHPGSAEEYARMMAAMGMTVDRAWTPLDAALTLAMWSVMMVGMMAGSATPMLLLYAGTQTSTETRPLPLSVLLFGGGYLAVWTGFSAAATAAQWTLQRLALLSQTMAAARPELAAAILIVAGIYQLTPLKTACLRECRSPLGFLVTKWRNGRAGAFRMGIEHGVVCLGCCWALMLVLFAVGVMNLACVAALAVIVLVEKIAPGGMILSRVSGVALLVAGAVVLFTA